jgi:hypothetical protein
MAGKHVISILFPVKPAVKQGRYTLLNKFLKNKIKTTMVVIKGDPTI